MWFIFPQLKGLGQSETARLYAIEDLAEAQQFLQHPILGANLIEISQSLLMVTNRTARDIFGYPDELKLRSSMTLFLKGDEQQTVFWSVLDQFFEGVLDNQTLTRLDKKTST